MLSTGLLLGLDQCRKQFHLNQWIEDQDPDEDWYSFTAQENQIFGVAIFRKCRQPGLDGRQGQRSPPMLLRVDIAMAALQIAPGEDVEENVGRFAQKGNGSGNGHI